MNTTFETVIVRNSRIALGSMGMGMCDTFFNMSAVPPCKGVIREGRSILFTTEILLPDGHIIMYYTKSALMFYFILFYLSIKGAKKEELCTDLPLQYIYVLVSPCITQKEDTDHFPQLF